MLRGLLRALGRLLWAGVLAAGFVLSAYLAFNGFVRRGEVILPDVVGFSLDEAESRLASAGVEINWRKERDRFDARVDAGKVVLQIPKGGTPAKRGYQKFPARGHWVPPSFGLDVLPDLPIDRRCSVRLHEKHVEGDLLASVLGAVHPRRPHGHARHSQSDCLRSFLQQAANVARRDVPL